MNKKQRKRLIRIIVSALMLILINLFKTDGVARLLLFMVIYFIIGSDILKKALLGIRNRRIFDENFLMAIATVGAFALAIYEKSGDYNEAIAVMLFYQIGELFQSYAVGKSRKNISELMDIRPDYANIELGGVVKTVSPREVEVGSIITVNPGEKIPLDGIVYDGNSTVDTSALTGESLPRFVKMGDEVISGCINESGVLKIRTTKSFGESTVNKILELVENASSRKSRSEKFISAFARVYTPAVCGSALALAVLPPVFSFITGNVPLWSVWLYRALTFLVISCPCALVISVPLSFFAGIGRASREGILIKGSNFLETMSQLKHIVFDKTGTLTEGEFCVSDISCEKIEKSKLIEYAALAECASSHPISKSLKKAYGKEIDLSRTKDIEEISGCGITATVDGVRVAAGNDRLMEKLGITCPEKISAGTAVYVAVGGEYRGTIFVSDSVKKSSAQSVEELRKLGIKKIVMLTGDLQEIAQAVGEELKIDEIYSELLPPDKVEKVERMLNEKISGEKLAFAGDGINDAPVLARADIGIAMGAMGSDAAIEAADVVLMDDNPMQIVNAIKISRRCIRIVRQNIVFSLAVKFLCLMLVAVGFADMWLGIFADVGVMVIAVINAVRILWR